MALVPAEHDIIQQICPEGTHNYTNVLTSFSTYYAIYVFLPVAASLIKSITCNEFRPSGQSSIKDTNPTIEIMSTNSNCVCIRTSNSSFSTYEGKAALAKLTIAY